MTKEVLFWGNILDFFKYHFQSLSTINSKRGACAIISGVTKLHMNNFTNLHPNFIHIHQVLAISYSICTFEGYFGQFHP